MKNVEIKARVDDLRKVEARARALATGSPQELAQDDTFFRCAEGHLKLRDFGDGRGELIHYRRPDEAGPKVSDYLVCPTDAPAALRETLARALGVTGRVVKVRRVYIVGRTRVHLDDVEGLGAFVELEVVLEPAEPLEQGEAEARRLMKELGISEAALVRGAYVDLMRP